MLSHDLIILHVSANGIQLSSWKFKTVKNFVKTSSQHESKLTIFNARFIHASFSEKKGKKREKKITRKKITSLLFFKSFTETKNLQFSTTFSTTFLPFFVICEIKSRPAFFPTLNFLFYSNTSCKIKFLSV